MMPSRDGTPFKREASSTTPRKIAASWKIEAWTGAAKDFMKISQDLQRRIGSLGARYRICYAVAILGKADEILAMNQGNDEIQAAVKILRGMKFNEYMISTTEFGKLDQLPEVKSTESPAGQSGFEEILRKVQDKVEELQTESSRVLQLGAQVRTRSQQGAADDVEAARETNIKLAEYQGQLHKSALFQAESLDEIADALRKSQKTATRSDETAVKVLTRTYQLVYNCIAEILAEYMAALLPGFLKNKVATARVAQEGSDGKTRLVGIHLNDGLAQWKVVYDEYMLGKVEAKTKAVSRYHAGLKMASFDNDLGRYKKAFLHNYDQVASFKDLDDDEARILFCNGLSEAYQPIVVALSLPGSKFTFQQALVEVEKFEETNQLNKKAKAALQRDRQANSAQKQTSSNDNNRKKAKGKGGFECYNCGRKHQGGWRNCTANCGYCGKAGCKRPRCEDPSFAKFSAVVKKQPRLVLGLVKGGAVPEALRKALERLASVGANQAEVKSSASEAQLDQRLKRMEEILMRIGQSSSFNCDFKFQGMIRVKYEDEVFSHVEHDPLLAFAPEATQPEIHNAEVQVAEHFIWDCGATHSLVNDAAHLDSRSRRPALGTVMGYDGSVQHIKEQGSKGQVQRIAVVPDARRNLLSLADVIFGTPGGRKQVLFTDRAVFVRVAQQVERSWGTKAGRYQHRLWRIRMDHPFWMRYLGESNVAESASLLQLPRVALMADVRPRDLAKLLHDRLGHKNFRTLARAVKLGIIDTGLKGLTSEMLVKRAAAGCLGCVSAKAPMKATPQEAVPLHIAWPGPCGSIAMDQLIGVTPAMPEGFTGFLFIYDMVSHAPWVYGFTRKSQSHQCVRHWILTVPARLRPEAVRAGMTIWSVRSDQAPELFRGEMAKLLRQFGCKIPQLANAGAKCHYQLGHAERCGRTLQENARAMMAQRGVPARHYAKALVDATKVAMVSPCQANAGLLTPYQVLTGMLTPLRVGMLRVFWSRVVIVETQDDGRLKSRRAQPTTYLGRYCGVATFDQGIKAYLILRDGKMLCTKVEARACYFIEVQSVAQQLKMQKALIGRAKDDSKLIRATSPVDGTTIYVGIPVLTEGIGPGQVLAYSRGNITQGHQPTLGDLGHGADPAEAMGGAPMGGLESKGLSMGGAVPRSADPDGALMGGAAPVADVTPAPLPGDHADVDIEADVDNDGYEVDDNGGEEVPANADDGPRDGRPENSNDSSDECELEPAEQRRSHRASQRPDPGPFVQSFMVNNDGWSTTLDKDLPLSQRKASRVYVPRSAADALSCADAAHWSAAMRTEISKMMDTHKAYRVGRPPRGTILIPTVWQFRVKPTATDNILRFKARWCMGGNRMTPGKHFKETSSPSLRLTTLRILLAIAAAFAWKLAAADFTGAYLNSVKPQDRAVWVRPPDCMVLPPGCALQQLKAVYGDPEGGKLWHDDVVALLKSLGLKPSVADPCLFFKATQASRLVTFLLGLFRDDTIYGGPDRAFNIKFTKGMMLRYKLGSLQPLSWFLGLRIVQNAEGIHIHLERYLHTVAERFNVPESMKTWKSFVSKRPLPYSHHTQKQICVPKDAEAAKERMANVPYAAMLGSIGWATDAVRLDTAYRRTQLARYLPAGRHDALHVRETRKVIAYLAKEARLGIYYRRLKQDESLTLEGWADSSYRDDPDSKRSTHSNIVLFHGAPIYWKAETNGRVSTGTPTSELIALHKLNVVVQWVVRLLLELGITVPKPRLFSDSSTTIAWVKTAKSPGALGFQLGVELAALREGHERGEFLLQHKPDAEMLADILNKATQKNQELWLQKRDQMMTQAPAADPPLPPDFVPPEKIWP